jgi:hypothetical protein
LDTPSSLQQQKVSTTAAFEYHEGDMEQETLCSLQQHEQTLEALGWGWC